MRGMLVEKRTVYLTHARPAALGVDAAAARRRAQSTPERSRRGTGGGAAPSPPLEGSRQSGKGPDRPTVTWTGSGDGSEDHRACKQNEVTFNIIEKGELHNSFTT